MPTLRRRSTASLRHRLLDGFGLWELSTGHVTRNDSPLKELYAENRDALLASRFFREADCVPFWRFEPGIPEELRRLPHESETPSAHYFYPGDKAAQAALEADVARVKGLRLAWLALHPIR